MLDLAAQLRGDEQAMLKSRRSERSPAGSGRAVVLDLQVLHSAAVPVFVVVLIAERRGEITLATVSLI